MSQTENLKKYTQFVPDALEKRPSEPDWLFETRTKAAAQFQAAGFPTRKQEAWKYIYLESLLHHSWILPQKQNSQTGSSAPLPGEILKEENRLVFVNGVFQPGQSQVSKEAQPFVATSLSGQTVWAQDCLGLASSAENNPFVAMNTVNFTEGFFLKIPKNTVIDKPIHVVFISEGNSTISHPRILVVAEEGASAQLFFYFQGNFTEPYFMNSTAEFILKPGSKISSTVCQKEGHTAVQFLNLRAQVQAGAAFECVSYTSGGSMTRNEAWVDLAGENASANVSGISILSENSQIFQHVLLNHQVPRGTSRQLFKNILAGKSVAEFNSMVHVWRDAKQSDSEQLDKNLLLSNNARVFSRPQLKIDNDDVKASHGAATGQLQEKEVFYLRSRGLDLQQANFLLVSGFAKQVLDLMPSEWLRRELESDMEAQVRQILQEEKIWP